MFCKNKALNFSLFCEKHWATRKATQARYRDRKRENMAHNNNWDKAKKLRFIESWNDDVPITSLAERFGMNNPSSYAADLRRQGFNVKIRERGKNLRIG